MIETLTLISVIAILVLFTFLFIISRYRKCPSDKIMVNYGKVDQGMERLYQPNASTAVPLSYGRSYRPTNTWI